MHLTRSSNNGESACFKALWYVARKGLYVPLQELGKGQTAALKRILTLSGVSPRGKTYTLTSYAHWDIIDSA